MQLLQINSLIHQFFNFFVLNISLYKSKKQIGFNIVLKTKLTLIKNLLGMLLF